MADEKSARRQRRVPAGDLAVGVWVVLVAGLVVLGSDLLWVVALGDEVRRTGAVPDGVPFAAAPQADWHHPMLLADLLASWADALGPWGLAAAHLLLVAVTLLVLVRDGRAAGAGELRLALSVTLVVVGAAATLVVARYPTLSLLPFVLLVALLRRDHRRPGPTLWLVPPLMVLWGNLHGAVLVGIAVLGVYVVAGGRRGLVRRGVVGLASLTCLVLTPSGLSTPDYYVRALSNEAAQRGTDLWSRPDLGEPLDVAMVAALLVLVVLARRSLRPWEWLIVAGLALGTLSAARHGVWLVLFLAPVAAVPGGLRGRAPVRRAGPTGRSVALGALGALVVAGLVAGQLARRGDAVRAPGWAAVDTVREVAGERVVLAVEPAAETFAQQGVRVWVANPVDAFPQQVQADFLDFLHDCTIPADAGVDVVVVDPKCAETVVQQGFTQDAELSGLVVLSR